MKMWMMLIGDVGAILLGLLYIFGAYGPTEAEVVTWGWLSLYLGIGLIFLSAGIGWSQKRADKVFLSLGHIGLALLQVFPILLWLSFHGSGLSDGTPPSIFVAHWLYSIPHLAAFFVSLMALYQLWWLPAPASAV